MAEKTEKGAQERCIKTVAAAGRGAARISYALSLLYTAGCDRLHIIDAGPGEAADLGQAAAFIGSHINIAAGAFEAAAGADILTVFGGGRETGEDDSAFMRRSAGEVRHTVRAVLKAGFDGILIIAAEPVDITTLAALEESGFPPERVIGTGTVAVTAALCRTLGDYFGVSPRDINAYVMGEHGDSGFIPWSQAMIGTKPVLEVCDDSASNFRFDEIITIADRIRRTDSKGGAPHGNAAAAAGITRAIFGDENNILTVSAFLRGEYGQSGVCAALPCIIGRSGIKSKIRLPLHEYEFGLMDDSCRILKSAALSLGG